MDLIINCIIGAIVGSIGFWIGWLTYKKNHTSNPVGNLKVCTGDPDGVYMFLESYVTPEYIMTQKTVTLSVDVTDVSHK